MALILQGNLGRGRLEQDLLYQFANDRGADLLLISEQYRTLSAGGWFGEGTGTAAIVVHNRDRFPVSDTGAGDGFVWIRSSGVTYFSCYITPNITIGVFRRESGDVALAGDLNAKATVWGETRTNPRGRAVLVMAARLDLTVLNSGDTATFRRIGTRGSVINVTLATASIAARVSTWTVLEDYTASDHQFIVFKIDGGLGRSHDGVYRKRSKVLTALRWMTRRSTLSLCERGGQNTASG